MNAAPVETFEQRGKLRRRQSHHPILDLGPAELTVFQTFGKQTDARAVPKNQLYSIGALRAENILTRLIHPAA
jgi:hypothetical protein